MLKSNNVFVRIYCFPQNLSKDGRKKYVRKIHAHDCTHPPFEANEKKIASNPFENH